MEAWKAKLTNAGYGKLIKPAVNAYLSNSLPFHNLEHITTVMKFLIDTYSELNPCVILASLYQDVIYKPSNVNNLNELASADFLKEKADENNISTLGVTIAIDLIKSTSLDWILTRGNAEYRPLAMLLDANLEHLGAPEKRFIEIEDKLIEEQDIDTSSEKRLRTARRNRSRFFNKLVNSRPYIYHTKEARALLECNAKHNMHNFIAKHGMDL